MQLHTVPARRAAVALLAALPGVVALAAPGGTTQVAAATTPGFATPTIVDPVNLYGEPDLRQDPAHPNVWYASGPWGTGTQLSIWNRSGDGAHTFQEMHDHPDPVHTGGSVKQPPGGGDTEVAVDHSGKFYGADLGALITQKALVSTDQGGTLQTSSVPRVFQDQNGAGTDRQWFGLWDPPDPIAAHNNSAYKGPFPVNYMVYLQAVGAHTPCPSNCETVASSVPTPDGNTSQVGLDYGCSADPNDKGSAHCPFWELNGDGYVFIDQLTGKVVQAIDSSGTGGDSAAVAVMTPGADGYMASAVEHHVASLSHAATNALFPAIAEDSARNAYYVWVERPDSSTRTANSWQVFYSWSPPGADSQWDHWSAPIKVSSPPSKTAIMPWVVAGTGGNIDIAWYGTDSLTTDPESESVSADATWYLYMAQVLGADSASPQITQVKAYDKPMHHGSICLSGTGCITIQGNRNLADFFEITKDTQGAAYIVFNNTANDLIQQVGTVSIPEGQIDHKGAEVVEVVRQISGMGLDGTPIDSPTDVGVYSMDDQAGDAHYDPITGPNYDALDLRGVSLSETADALTFTVKVTDPSKLSALVTAEPPQADDFADYVVRWEYQSTVYFAAVEVPVASGTPATFFDGKAQTVDLCSVSACDPHIMTYPGPTVAPTTSHLATGSITNPGATSGAVSPAVSATTGSITITVPRSDVGNPKQGDRLDSVGAWSLLSLSSSLVPLPNTSAQTDKVPVVVDGACCFTPVTVASTSGSPPASPTPSPSSGAGPATIATPNTAAAGLRSGGVAASVALMVLLAAAVGRRRGRRR